MSDNTSYVILSEIRDLLRQSVELQKQTLAEVRKQVQMEQSLMSNPELFATRISPDFFSEILGQITPNSEQDNDNINDDYEEN
jgi:hypothetical protein